MNTGINSDTNPDKDSGVVRAHTDADLVKGEHACVVAVALSWRAEDPYAVEMVFTRDQGDPAERDWRDGVSWMLSRELLTEGLSSPAGNGDVRVRPHPGDWDVTVIELHGPAGTAVFEFDAAELQDFLSDTYDQVPDGAEDLVFDLDDEIEWLLNDAA
jgi:hypothetical protein